MSDIFQRMKALKYFSYFILILFSLFVITGLIFDEIKYSSQVTINQPVDKVWNVITDDTQLEHWVKNFKSIETIEGSNEVPGSTFQVTVIDGGEEYILIKTVKSVKKNEYYAIDYDNEVLTNNLEFIFKENSEGTVIITNEQISGKGILMKSIFVFMKGMFESESQKSLDRLKILVEES